MSVPVYMYVFVFVYVSTSTCLYHKACLSQDQRLTSGIGLYLLPCLRESLLMFTAAYATLVVQNLVIPLISASQLQAVHQDYNCMAVLLDFDVISKGAKLRSLGLELKNFNKQSTSLPFSVCL